MAEEDDYREVIRRLEIIERDQGIIINSLKDLTSKKSGLDLLPESWAKSLLLYLRTKNFLWYVPFIVLTMIFVAALAGAGWAMIFWLINKFFL